MEEGYNTGTMIKLTATNYTLWKPKMEDLLVCRDLFDPIESKGKFLKTEENIPEPGAKDTGTDSGKRAETSGTTSETLAWNKLNRKAVATIRQWVDNSVFSHVAKETDAYTLWAKLENLYERKSAQNKAFLFRKLVNQKYKEGRPVAEHLSDIQELVNRLATMTIVIDDELHALMLLGSLPDSWETLVVSLSNSAPDGKLTLTMVKDSIMNEETRRKDLGITDGQAYLSESRGRDKSRAPKGRDKSRGRSKSREGRKCFHCGKYGHIKRNCWS